MKPETWNLELSSALGLLPNDVVSFVGAGGKTSALVRLAGELVKAGEGVVITTTTHIREPNPPGGFGPSGRIVILLEEDEATILRMLPDLVRHHRLVAVVAGYARQPGTEFPTDGRHQRPSPSNLSVGVHDPLEPADLYRKLRGISPDLVGRIAALPGIDHVLVEADGARGRSLKAPADYEPAVPAATTLLVPVAGLDAVGRPLDATIAHRPERLTELYGIRQGETITANAVAAVLAHNLGGLKGCPPAARVVPFLNKAESDADRQMAEEIAGLLLHSPAIAHVVAGAALGTGPTFRRIMKHGT